MALKVGDEPKLLFQLKEERNSNTQREGTEGKVALHLLPCQLSCTFKLTTTSTATGTLHRHLLLC